MSRRPQIRCLFAHTDGAAVHRYDAQGRPLPPAIARIAFCNETRIAFSLKGKMWAAKRLYPFPGIFLFLQEPDHGHSLAQSD